MDETPQASVDKDTVFRTEKGLETYSYSFYNMLPSVSDGFRQDAMCDYGAVTSFDNFIREGAYSAELSSGWSWSDLRNINYFIENCMNEAVDESVRNNYIGLARFFRAYFYYEMVVRFGDVPWIDRTLGVDDELLYAPRDSRTIVMDHVLEDLDFACENISRTKDETGSLVTKWVAYALKSRICLFEASFRKYHTELGLTDSADEWYQEAVRAAETVMKESGHSIYTGEGTDASFRSLFISDKPVTSEVMLASCADAGLAVLGEANWWWTSGTYGARFSMIRTFVNTFLNTDGTPFTDRAGYETMEFYDECQNRDARLAQTIRTPGYERDGVPALQQGVPVGLGLLLGIGLHAGNVVPGLGQLSLVLLLAALFGRIHNVLGLFFGVQQLSLIFLAALFRGVHLGVGAVDGVGNFFGAFVQHLGHRPEQKLLHQKQQNQKVDKYPNDICVKV